MNRHRLLVAGLSEYNFDDSEMVMVAWSVRGLLFVATSGETRRVGSAERIST